MDKPLVAGLLAGLALLALWFTLRANTVWLAGILGFACFLWFTHIRRR